MENWLFVSMGLGYMSANQTKKTGAAAPTSDRPKNRLEYLIKEKHHDNRNPNQDKQYEDQ